MKRLEWRPANGSVWKLCLGGVLGAPPCAWLRVEAFVLEEREEIGTGAPAGRRIN